MRNLFLALVLANLAFAAWHAWFAEPRVTAHIEGPGVPRLTLLREVPDDLRTSGAVDETVVNRPTSEGAPVSPEPATGNDAKDEPPDELSTSTSDAGNELNAGAASEPSALGDETSEALGDGADSVADAAATPPNEADESLKQCTSVGPFRELSQAATAAATLRASGYIPQQRVAQGEIWIGYWVYIQAIPTLPGANEILAKVRAEGITDSYVISNSDTGNLVSLGVFSEISGVARRREQVRALGYEPTVVDRTRRDTVYWVDVMLAPDQSLDFEALQPPGRIVRLEQRPCESAVD